MPTIRRSVAISLIERYLSIGLSLISFVVIARLLTPNDIGLFSLATAIIGMAQVMRDFGVVTYLIQETELTKARIRTAFGITAILSFALFAATFGAASWVAGYYADDRLTGAMRILAISFLLIPFGATSLALLRREMRFDALFVINLGATIANFSVAILLAWLGHGHMSLIWAAVASTAVTTLLALYYSPGDAKLLPSLSEWRRVLQFGSRLTFTGVITEVSMSINDLVIGKVMGVPAVAFVSRAQGVMNLMHRDMLGAVASVMLPALARERREGGDLDVVYQRCVGIISVVAWPFYGFLALFPHDTLRYLFGPQWDEAAGLVPLFCLAGAVAVFWRMTSSLLQAMGRADLVMRSELIIQPTRIAFLAAIIVFSKSLMAFAAGFALIYLFHLPVYEHARRVAYGFRSALLTQPVMQSGMVTVLSLSPASLVAVAQHFQALPGHNLAGFATIAAATGASWILACRWVRHPISADPAFSFLWDRIFGRKQQPPPSDRT